MDKLQTHRLHYLYLYQIDRPAVKEKIENLLACEPQFAATLPSFCSSFRKDTKRLLLSLDKRPDEYFADTELAGIGGGVLCDVQSDSSLCRPGCTDDSDFLAVEPDLDHVAFDPCRDGVPAFAFHEVLVDVSQGQSFLGYQDAAGRTRNCI